MDIPVCVSWELSISPAGQCWELPPHNDQNELEMQFIAAFKRSKYLWVFVSK